MPTHHKVITAALFLPLLLGSCSDKGDQAGTSPRSPTPAGGTASASTSTRPSPTGFPIATVYQVTAKPGVTDKQLQDAVDRIAKLPGVQAASVNRKLHQVRVDLSAINISKNAPAVYHALEELGTVKAI